MPDKNVIDELVVQTSIDADQKSFETAISNFNQVRARASSAASSGVGVLDAALGRVGVTAKAARQQLGGFTRSGAAMLSNFSGLVKSPETAQWTQKPKPKGKPVAPNVTPFGMSGVSGAIAGALTAGAFNSIIDRADSIAKMAKAFDIDAKDLQGLAHLHASYGGSDVEGFNLGTQLQAMQNAMTMGVLPSNLQAAQTFAASKGYDKNLVDVFDDKDLSRVDLIGQLAKAFEGIKPFDQQQILNMLGIQGVGQRNILQQGQAVFAKEFEHSKRFSISQSTLDSSENTAQFMSDMKTRAKNFSAEVIAHSVESLRELNPVYSFEKQSRLIEQMRANKNKTVFFAPKQDLKEQSRTNMNPDLRAAPAPFVAPNLINSKYASAQTNKASTSFKPAPITININQTNNNAQNADEVAQKTGALTQKALERVLQNYKESS